MPSNNTTTQQQQQERLAAAAAATGQPMARAARPPPRPLSDNATEVLRNCKIKPSHVKASTKIQDLTIGGGNILMNGLVAFSHTNAAATAAAAAALEDETSKKEALKERAKLLSQLYRLVANNPTTTTDNNSSSFRPPTKGSTMVIGLSYDQLLLSSSSNNKPQDALIILSKVLSNLASYYTLLVMVQVDTNDDNDSDGNSLSASQRLHDEVVRELYGSSGSLLLNERTLPSHRILLSSSTTGRIALVRQLETVELVVDFDLSVQQQLGRFGYKVAVVQDWVRSFPWLQATN